jgi:polar amino acid transport system substrate-binding protein
VAKDRPDLRDAIDAALGAVIADGRLRSVWHQWMPTLDFPLVPEDQ